MKHLKLYITWLLSLLVSMHTAQAYLIYHPISFTLSTDKDSYYEGEKITFYITITNTDKERTLPVLLPHTQNVGKKLFYLSAYDKANNTMLLRYLEDTQLKMLLHDAGSVKIKHLKPQEQIVIPIYLNDFENYYSYHTQNSSHHSFGVPLFAGIYKVNVTYSPMGLALGDSIYTYYSDNDKSIPYAGKQLIPTSGQITNMIELKIKRSKDTIVTIERNTYYIKKEHDRYFYLIENLPTITTDIRCHHITDLPPDSCSKVNEYFYSHFLDQYAEYIARFNDGDIREYRKFLNTCPDYLFTELYNSFKQIVLHAQQLPDKRFYRVTYHQPGGRKHQETYCSADGTLCLVTTYVYDKGGEFKKTEITENSPCIEVEIDGKKRSYQKGIQLEGVR